MVLDPRPSQMSQEDGESVNPPIVTFDNVSLSFDEKVILSNVSFHNSILLPIIIAISVFVLFLMVYACIRFRASANPVPSKRTHNVAVEVLWTLIPCLILIVMAVPSFKILYKQDTIPKADLTIKAIGYQWYWGYEYPDENIIFDSFQEVREFREELQSQGERTS